MKQEIIQLRNLVDSAKALSTSLTISIRNNMPIDADTRDLLEIVKQIIPLIKDEFGGIANVLLGAIGNIKIYQIIQVPPYGQPINKESINLYYLRDMMTAISILDSLYIVESNKGNKCKKIFISHKSEDEPFVNALVNLLRLYIGSDSEKIFCSSISNYKIGIGKEIYPTIKSQFEDYEVLTIIIHSPRYYQSSVCLNEMGAAWIMNTECYSFLTADCKYEDLKGTIDDRFISIKVNAKDAEDRMNEFICKIMDFFNLSRPDLPKLSQWEKDRNEFLKTVCNLKLDIENT